MGGKEKFMMYFEDYNTHVPMAKLVTITIVCIIAVPLCDT